MTEIDLIKSSHGASQMHDTVDSDHEASWVYDIDMPSQRSIPTLWRGQVEFRSTSTTQRNGNHLAIYFTKTLCPDTLRVSEHNGADDMGSLHLHHPNTHIRDSTMTFK